MEVKTEADDITEYSHDDQLTTGVFNLSVCVCVCVLLMALEPC